MSQPPEYERQYDFSGFSDTNPMTQQPGAQLDAEFDAIKATLDAVRANLALIQRDDGKLKNRTVGIDQLDNGALALFAAGKGMNVRGPWVSGNEYLPGDIVSNANNLYLTMSKHVAAGSLSTDVTAGRMVGPVFGSA